MVTELTVLTPSLTKFDKAVLRALNPWPEAETLRCRMKDKKKRFPEAASEWVVAEILKEDDVAFVRRTLRGLCHLGYVSEVGPYNKLRWLRHENGTALLLESVA